jgi:hypothetical protein
VGDAVKVTEVPEHTVFEDAKIEILTGRFVFTVMVTVFEVAGLPVGQVVFEVSPQETASLLAGE